MLTYKTDDLINKATMLCDLKNNSFLTADMSIQLLNDAYIQCYQKLIDIKHDDFLETVDVVNNDELPSNLYQIAEVYYIYKDNPFIKYNLIKNKDYMIRGNRIRFRDNYSNCQYCIDYYPIPDTLTLNESGKDSHNFNVLSMGVPYDSTTETNNLCAQVGKYIYYGVVGSNTLYKIEYGKTNCDAITLSGNITSFFGVNDYLAVNISGKYYKFDKSGNYTEIVSADPVNTYNDDTHLFSYDSTVSRKVIFSNTEKSFTGSENAFTSIKYKDSSFLVCSIDTNIYYVKTATTSETFTHNVIVSKVTDANHYIYSEIVNSGSVVSCFRFTNVYNPSEGTSILTVPNNAFYSLLSYDLAIAIKTISGEDVSTLSALRENAYLTFCDTMKKDITPYVIDDVYTNNNRWF